MSVSIIDAEERHAALDPAQSFIVQAPAGSGKTELLIQRYLRLLTLVDQPEEIIAITFTRKAAAEMRHRLLHALDGIQNPEPDEPHKQTTWRLAREVGQRDQQRDWRIQDNPHQLRIQTFDSLAASLTRQMPILSELGAQPSTEESPNALYQQAAHATIQDLTDTAFAQHLAPVLRHLDNRLGQLEALLCDMLQKRDQWLPHVFKTPDIDQLEAALRHYIEQHLTHLRQSIPDNLLTEWINLAIYAAGHLGQDHPLAIWRECHRHPTPQWDNLPLWQGLARLVLSDRDTLRRSVDKRSGFPAPTEKGLDANVKFARRNAKERLMHLLDQLREMPALVEQLAWTKILPGDGYHPEQAGLLNHLLQVLLRAAMHLKLTFQDHAKVDFAEIQQRAIQALGAEGEPTDLALILDHQLRHLLVDEFQDTSNNQYHLLRLLTDGWRMGDGRSLFVVGDPMQSIYRFREAEVGLYLQTQENGLGDLALTPLTLKMNFRSRAGVVNWINQTFQQLFPGQTDVARGAVRYSASQATNANEQPAVHWHPQAGRDDADEAKQISQLIQATQRNTPDASIAMLARSRSHLHAIANQLRTDGIPYQAIDINPLSERTVIQDLRSLTRALLHPADRLAWLAILRAPWCGLSLSDLLTIAEDHAQPIYHRLQESTLTTQISPDGGRRIERLLSLLKPNLPYRGQPPLRTWVESIWINLGGLALVQAEAQTDADAYFNLLDKLQTSTGLIDLAVLDEQLAQLYAAPEHGSATGHPVQMMTMHAAKGLEFDVVILPGLGRKPRQDSSELLYWQERPSASGQSQLLMAPIRANQENHEPISDFIRALNKEKNALETVRLLYVAITRARQQVHLFAHCEFNAKGEPRPPANSLLQTFWPIAVEQFSALQPANTPEPSTLTHSSFTEQRLAADWRFDLPDPPTPLTAGTQSAQADKLDLAWSDDPARHVGTLIHRYLERIANEGMTHWPVERIDPLKPCIQASLTNLGVTAKALEPAGDKTIRALKNALQDATGRWILDDHAEAACELALGIQDDNLQHYVIDRTFIDATGIRWIIDYKTSEPQDETVDDFLNREKEHYCGQLENYGRIMHFMEKSPIKLALYFPLLKAWQVWDYAVS